MATFTSVPIGDNDDAFPNLPPPGTDEVDPRVVYGTGGKFADGHSSPAFYPDYSIRTIYIGSTGILQAPVAGALGTPARTVRKAAPYTKKVVAWKAQRVMEKPVLPHWDGNNPQEVLTWFVIIPHDPVLLAGGENYVWKVEGVYVYALGQTPALTDDFYAGITPLFNSTTEAMKTQGYQFSRELLRSKPPAPYTGTDDQKFLSGDGRVIGDLGGGLYPGP